MPLSGRGPSVTPSSIRLTPARPRRSIVSRFRGSAKWRTTDCAICGPMPEISATSASPASSSAAMLPKRAARSWAARSPTMRMPSALRRRLSPRLLEAWMAAWRLPADFSASRSSSASVSTVRS